MTSAPDINTAKKGLTKRVYDSVFGASFLHALTITVELIFTMILARLLTPADYGIVAAAMLFIALCNLVRDVGIGATIIQLPKLSVDHQRTGLTLVLIVSVVLFIAAQLLAPAFAAFVNVDEAQAVLRVLSFIILIQSASAVAQGLLLRDMRARSVVGVELLSKVVSLSTIGLYMALSGYGYWALVWASVFDAAIRSAALIILAKPPLTLQFNVASAKTLMSVGSGFTVSKFINFIALRADVTIIARYLDAQNLGLYSRAYKLMSLPTDLYGKIADRIVFPAYAAVQEDADRLKNGFLRGVILSAQIGLPLVPILLILAPDIILVLLGPKWMGVTPIFLMLSAGIYFRLAGRFTSSLLRAKGAVPQMISAQVIYAAMTIGGALYAKQFGIVAVASAISIAILIWSSVTIVFACRLAKLSARAYFTAHRYGAALSIVIAIALSLLAALTNALALSSFASLFLAGVLLASIGLALCYFQPSALLCPEARGLCSKLMTKAEQIIKTRLSKAKL